MITNHLIYQRDLILFFFLGYRILFPLLIFDLFHLCSQGADRITVGWEDNRLQEAAEKSLAEEGGGMSADQLCGADRQ